MFSLPDLLSYSELRYIHGLDDDLDDQGRCIVGEPHNTLIRRVYRYRDDRYRVTFMVPHAPKDLVDLPDDIEPSSSPYKLHNNIVRAQSEIQALGLCNDWDYFITCTLDPEKFPDRLALDDFRRKLVQLFKDIKRQYHTPCKFLLVPELHKNEQGWHMHGLLYGFPDSLFREFSLQEKLPDYIRGKLAQGLKVYDFPRYRKRFGFVDVEPLQSRDAAVAYLCKYVVKGMTSTGMHIEKGKHLYFASRGLNRPELVEVSNQYESSPVIDDLEFDGLVPCFDHDIRCEVDGVEGFFGYTVWYEFDPVQGVPFEDRYDVPKPVSMRRYSDWRDSVEV